MDKNKVWKLVQTLIVYLCTFTSTWWDRTHFEKKKKKPSWSVHGDVVSRVTVNTHFIIPALQRSALSRLLSSWWQHAGELSLYFRHYQDVSFIAALKLINYSMVKELSDQQGFKIRERSLHREHGRNRGSSRKVCCCFFPPLISLGRIVISTLYGKNSLMEE